MSLNKIVIKFISIYTPIFVFILLLGGLSRIRHFTDIFLPSFYLPLVLFFIFKFKKIFPKLQIFLSIYSFLFTFFIFISCLLNLRDFSNFFFVLAVFPFPLYFLIFIKPHLTPSLKKRVNSSPLSPTEKKVVDDSKRKFLRLVAGTSLTTILLFLFNRKKASAAFFGSVPGPGTISLKDAAGSKIDPAIKQPLDGYNISNIDTSTTVHYYGFLNKTGDWYIIKEDSLSNTLLYAKGNSGYAVTNWLNWASSQSYDYFNATFSE